MVFNQIECDFCTDTLLLLTYYVKEKKLLWFHSIWYFVKTIKIIDKLLPIKYISQSFNPSIVQSKFTSEPIGNIIWHFFHYIENVFCVCMMKTRTFCLNPIKNNWQKGEYKLIVFYWNLWCDLLGSISLFSSIFVYFLGFHMASVKVLSRSANLMFEIAVAENSTMQNWN